MMRDKATWAVAAAALAVGVAAGFVCGRGQLNAQWSRGARPIAKAQHDRSAAGDANPTPAIGEKVFGPMPIGWMRKEVATLTAHDPVLVTVAAVGANEEGYELHLVVENRGTCEVVAYSGVAYGFGPSGGAAPLNRGGEQYAAFRMEKTSGRTLLPEAKHTYSHAMHHCEGATLVVAHVDDVTCANGTHWSRPAY